MADNASIARPYAKAVFELASDAKAFDAWSVTLETLALIAKDNQFKVLIGDPRVSEQQVVSLLLDLVGEGSPEGTENFIRLLAKNNRTEALEAVVSQFKAMVAKAKEIVNAQVVTAIAMSAEQKQSLAAALEKKLGLKVTIEEIVDNTLMGGAIVKAGDLVIDGSAKGRIEKLTTALMR
jgi:F-type H+-transporting ATPase subunit delta